MRGRKLEQLVLTFVLQAELAPGKARITKVREWLYEAIHGVPEAAVHSQGYSPSTAVRDRLRKYKVS